MAAFHFTAMPCEPNIANRHIESYTFGEIRPCDNNVYAARFEVFRTFLCIFSALNI